MPYHQACSLPAISAHRGGAEVAPAGTWDAFNAALDASAEYVEFDVRQTRDGTWVVFHDEHTGMPARPVRALHYEELCETAGYLIPKATAVMEILARRVIGHLDLKEPTDEKAIVGPAIDIFGAGGFIATTEHPASIRRMRSFAPAVRTALSTGKRRVGLSQWRQPTSPNRRFDPRWVIDSGADCVALNHNLANERVLRTFRRNGVGVLLWTVNDPTLITRHLADTRIDVLITDRPRLASGIRSEMATPGRELTTSSAAGGPPATTGVQSEKRSLRRSRGQWT
jgi:glycerophosphoryl diester phosphodiesterase